MIGNNRFIYNKNSGFVSFMHHNLLKNNLFCYNFYSFVIPIPAYYLNQMNIFPTLRKIEIMFLLDTF